MEQMQTHIEQTLTAQLAPEYLQLINESYMHAVPENSETHFKVVAVSDAFAGLRAVQRHQLVYAMLAEPLRSGVHALSLALFTPAEWSANGVVHASPACMNQRSA